MPNYFELLRTGKEKKLLDAIKSIDVDQTNELGRSLLHIAIAHGRRQAANALVDNGADVNLSDKHHGYSPLHVAAEYGDAELVELLLRSGADPNLADKHGNSPLWTAVFQARNSDDGIAIVEMLVKAGADPTPKNEAGRSPLDMAVRFEDDDLIKALSPRKKKPSKRKRT